MLNGVSSSRAPQFEGTTRAMNFLVPYKGNSISSAPVQVYSPAEVPHFELKEDPSFWMDHTVQTGSGKTHTMLGEINDLEIRLSPNRGMTPRIFEFLFARIKAEEESRRNEKLQYNCSCAFLEIYNEQITDLLNPSSTNLLASDPIADYILFHTDYWGIMIELHKHVHSVNHEYATPFGLILKISSQLLSNTRVEDGLSWSKG